MIACLAFDEGPTTIQVWDLLKKKEVATVENAHTLEVTTMINYFYNSQQSNTNNNPLDSALFVTAGKDGIIKVWELSIENSTVKLLYQIELAE